MIRFDALTAGAFPRIKVGGGVQDPKASGLASLGIGGHPSPVDYLGEEMSSEAVQDEVVSEAPDSRFPGWLQLGLIVIAGSAGYTLLAYLLWLWTS